MVKKTVNICLAALLVITTGAIVLIGSVPPVSRDALTHHLAIPKLYLQHGGIYEIPSNSFSYYPMNLDLLYIIPLYLGMDHAAKYIHFAFALLTAWIIYTYVKRRISSTYALFGALFFLTIPIVVKLSITAYVDLGLIFFLTAALVGIFFWREAGFTLRWLIISAICCGLALGTKYNGLVGFFILALMVPYSYAGAHAGSLRKQVSAAGFGVFFVLVAMVVFSPWLARNYMWTSNPIYPLMNQRITSLLSGSSVGAAKIGPENSTREKASKQPLGAFGIRKLVYGEHWLEIVTIPVRIFFQGRDNDPKFFDGKLNPFLFAFPLLLLFGPKEASSDVKREKRLLIAYVVIFIAVVLFQKDMRIRYVAPVIPPMVILSCFGLYQLERQIRDLSPGRYRFALMAVGLLAGAAALTANFAYVAEQFKKVAPVAYLDGSISRDAYIEKYRPEYPLQQYMNQELAGDAKVLGIFMGNRSYYLDRQIIFGNNQFTGWVRKKREAREIYEQLDRAKYTHIMVGHGLFNNWIQTAFTTEEKQRLKTFLEQHTERVMTKNGYGLYKLTRPTPGVND